MPEIVSGAEQIKVFILYLLFKIGYPISYNDLATIVIRDGYVDYFDFVTYFHELLDLGLVSKIAEPNDDTAEGLEMYTVSPNGKTVAKDYSSDVLLDSIREKSYLSAIRHLSLEKKGAVINHSIENTGDGYMFNCMVKDREGTVFNLSLRAESYSQVSKMLGNFEDRPDLVYKGLLSVLTGDVNYLMEK